MGHAGMHNNKEDTMSEKYFKLDVKMNDTDLRDADQIAELLMGLAASISARMMGDVGEKLPVRDTNGNRVGQASFADYPDFHVSDADTTGGSYGCGEEFYDADGDATWTCSRDEDHNGPHAAGNGSYICAVWQE